MKFSVTVEFGDYEKYTQSLINEDAEAGQLARAVFTMLRERVFTVPSTDPRRIGEPGEHALALLLSNMAAGDKLTELRILHSILVTYADYLGHVRLESYRDVRRHSDAWNIEVELEEHAHIHVDVDGNGKNIQRRVRNIDMIERPNHEGDVAPLDDSGAPKRRMRLRTTS